MELMVALSIGSIVTTAVCSLMFYTGRSYAAMANYVELDHRSRMALDTVTQQIRESKRLLAYSTTSLTFEDSDGGTLLFQYDPEAKTLTRWKDGVADPEPLLTECDQMEFYIYQRNPIAGSYDQYPTASADTCKLVQLRWVCSRTILGDAINTESVQSAKIVIRKQ